MRYRAVDHPLATAFVLALSVRLINLALLRGNAAFFAENDTVGYWEFGAGLARPDRFWPTLLAMTDRTPLYPLLIGAMRGTFGDAPRLIALAQAVIDAGTCTLIAALGTLVSPRVGFIAGILAALSVTLIVFSTQLLTETLFLFFFTSMLPAGAYFMRAPSLGLALLAGVAGGLALATRPAVALLLVAAVPLVFIVAVAGRRSFAAAFTAAAMFAIGAAAPIAPVLARNVVHYGHFSPELADRLSPCLLDRPAGDGARRRHALSGHLGSDERALSAGADGARPHRRLQPLCSLGDKDRDRTRRDGAAAARGLRQGLARGHGDEPRRAGAARRPTRAVAAETQLLPHTGSETGGAGERLPAR